MQPASSIQLKWVLFFCGKFCVCQDLGWVMDPLDVECCLSGLKRRLNHAIISPGALLIKWLPPDYISPSLLFSAFFVHSCMKTQVEAVVWGHQTPLSRVVLVICQSTQAPHRQPESWRWSFNGLMEPHLHENQNNYRYTYLTTAKFVFGCWETTRKLKSQSLFETSSDFISWSQTWSPREADLIWSDSLLDDYTGTNHAFFCFLVGDAKLTQSAHNEQPHRNRSPPV